MKEDKHETISNISLIINGLDHILFELERKNSSYFRIAKESHLVLSRMMVEALKGSDNASIIGNPHRKKFKIVWGDIDFYEAVNCKVEGCAIAWRYSKPEICEEPINASTKKYKPQSNEKLVSFYHLLAMIQNEDFMKWYIISKPISVTDEEMKKLEWLHESIRNDYEHFIPKYKSVKNSNLIMASSICFKISKKLLTESGNIFPTHFDKKDIENQFEKIIRILGKT